jgi:hypothetical protein
VGHPLTYNKDLWTTMMEDSRSCVSAGGVQSECNARLVDRALGEEQVAFGMLSNGLQTSTEDRRISRESHEDRIIIVKLRYPLFIFLKFIFCF